MRFRPRSPRRDDPRASSGAAEDQAFDALWERHGDDLERTAMAIVQDAEHAREALEQARADALRERVAEPQSLTRARLHRLVRDAAGDRIELFATRESPAEVDARTALLLHELGLRVEEIAEALALTQAATRELLPAPAPRPVTAFDVQEASAPEPLLEQPRGREPEPVTIAFEPELEPIATPPARERRRRPVWQPLAGGGVAVAAVAGALILLVPGGGPAPVTNGATGLGIGPALPPPAADGSGRPDTSSFGLLASSPESRTPRAAPAPALVADASQAPNGSERGSSGGGGERSANGASPGGGGPSGGGNAPSGGGDRPSGGGDRPSGGGDAPSGRGDRPSGGGDAPSGGGGPSDRGPSGGGDPSGGGAPSGGGPVGGGGAPPAAGGGAAGAPASSPPPPSSPSPASSPPPNPVEQLVNETVATVERVAGSLLGGG